MGKRRRVDNETVSAEIDGEAVETTTVDDERATMSLTIDVSKIREGTFVACEHRVTLSKENAKKLKGVLIACMKNGNVLDSGRQIKTYNGALNYLLERLK